MHRRFAGAPQAALQCPGGTIRVALAKNFRLRLAGLIGLSDREIVPLLFPRCRSIHTLGMKTPIDLVWLALEDEKASVLEVAESIQPKRRLRAKRDVTPKLNVAALELAPGDATKLGLRPGVMVVLG